jgi:hypothetical protein
MPQHAHIDDCSDENYEPDDENDEADFYNFSIPFLQVLPSKVRIFNSESYLRFHYY